MTMLHPILFLLIAALVLLIAALCAQDVTHEVLAPRLTPQPNLPDHGPLVSIIIPARNEAARIGPCLEGLARQHYRDIEIIVIDDHSTDATVEVVQRYQDRIPTLRILRGAELPGGWAGKCWACWQASEQARGAWLLFLDADVEPRPALVTALVQRVQQANLDVLSLMPLLRLGSLAELLVLPAFQTMLRGVYPLRRVNDPHWPRAFANGQCILIRHSVYAALDGHRAVRGSILEDADFGQHVKTSGYRLEMAEAQELFAVRMYTDWSSLAEGLTKNAKAGFRSGGTRSLWIGARQSLLAFAPLYMLIGGAAVWLNQPGAPLAVVLLLHALGLWLLVSLCVGWLTQRRSQVSLLWGLCYPLGLAIYFGLTLNAMFRLRRGQGVRWKGRVIVDAE